MFNKYLLFGTLMSILTISCKAVSTLPVKIDPQKIITHSFLGNGVQWSAYPHADAPSAEWGQLMTDEKWEKVFLRLDYMKPALVRVMDQANWRYLKGFDASGEPILDFACAEVKALEKLLNYCQKNQIDVLLGEWGCPYKVHDPSPELSSKFTGANDPSWSAIIVRFLDYLINQKGYSCIKYYNLVNEPNGNWASTDGNWDEWSSGVKVLKSALDKAGLSGKISIAGPDAVAHYDHPTSKFTGAEWVSESAKQLNKELGIFDLHAYPDYDIVRSGRFTDFYSGIASTVKSTGKPIIFSEIGFNRDTPANQKRVKNDPYSSEDSQMSVYDFSYGIDMADALIQIMNSGYSSALAWALDDAMHTKDDKGDKKQLKRWGFWNILGTELCNNPDDEKIRPWFYPWSLMCRYFPKGTSIITTSLPATKGLRLVTGKTGENFSIAIVNQSGADQQLVLDLKSIASKKFRKYLYSEKIRPVDGNDFPVAQEKVSLSNDKTLPIDVPANSFILFTTLDF